MTVAIRFQSMPVKETLMKFCMGPWSGAGSYYLSIIATPVNGSTAAISIEHSFNRSRQTVQTPFQISLNNWYLLVITNRTVGFDINCMSIKDIASKSSAIPSSTKINANGALFGTNATWSPAPGQAGEACTFMIATQGYVNVDWWPGVYGTSSFTYDLAWVHFFDYIMEADDLLRECNCDWIYTDFTQSFNNYKLAA